MFVWHDCLRRVATRKLEFIVLQFLVVVILPNNAIGTPELPAVGANRLLCNADNRSVAPSTGRPAVFEIPLGHERATDVAGRSLVSRQPAISAADVLQLSRRLRT